MNIPRVAIVIEVPAGLRQQLKIVAAERGQSLKSMLMPVLNRLAQAAPQRPRP